MFSSKQPSAAGRPARSGTPSLSFIGPEVIISGDLATDAQLHVDGRIDGNVRCAQLIQGPDGIISGNIHAEEARLAGTVEGTVSAATISIEASARILGDVAYDTIGIEAGARIEGRLGRRAGAGKDDEAQPSLIATPVSFSPGRGADSGLVAESR
ncbi:MAG: polymer-forming cytoskeletal protein [Sphingomonadaceae bacterium]|nr:polymer-forming cytoskeletal protein [Sphingomonadaceae bacterium]